MEYNVICGWSLRNRVNSFTLLQCLRWRRVSTLCYRMLAAYPPAAAVADAVKETNALFLAMYDSFVAT